MRSTRKVTFGIIPTILIGLTVVLCACSDTSNKDLRPLLAKLQILNQAEAGIADIGTFDPAMVASSTSLAPICMVFTGLVTLDEHQKVVPELAQSWSASSDGLIWTFKLRAGLTFSDGTALTSQDVIYSLNRALQPSLRSPVAPEYLNLIKDSDKLLSGKISTIIGDSIFAPAANTVIIKLAKPASYFLSTLTYPTSFVVEKKLIDTYGNVKFTDHLNEGGGSGPFKVKTYIHGKEIVLVPNPHYSNAKPRVTVNFIFYKDANAAYQAYRNGQLDLTPVPPPYLSQVQATKEYHQTPTLSIYYYALNFKAKPFDNIKIRQAFELALNKNQIVKVVYKNSVVATNHIIPDGIPGYNPNLKGPDGTTNTSGNLALAQRLFATGLHEEGYSSVAALPKLQFSYVSESPEMTQEIEIAVNEWKEVLGVNIQAQSMDFETLVSAEPATVGNGKLQMFQSSWNNDYPDAQDFTTLQFSKDSPNNTTNYGQNSSSVAAQQVQVQNELHAADVEKDLKQRNALYANAEQQLVNDVAWLPMYQGANVLALKTYVHGYTFDAAGLIPPFAWSSISIIKH